MDTINALIGSISDSALKNSKVADPISFFASGSGKSVTFFLDLTFLIQIFSSYFVILPPDPHFSGSEQCFLLLQFTDSRTDMR